MKRRIGKIKNRVVVEGGGTNTLKNNEVLVEGNTIKIRNNNTIQEICGGNSTNQETSNKYLSIIGFGVCSYVWDSSYNFQYYTIGESLDDYITKESDGVYIYDKKRHDSDFPYQSNFGYICGIIEKCSSYLYVSSSIADKDKNVRLQGKKYITASLQNLEENTPIDIPDIPPIIIIKIIED